MPIQFLAVDDSALVRKLLTEWLNADPGIEVVGAVGSVRPLECIAGSLAGGGQRRAIIGRIIDGLLTLSLSPPSWFFSGRGV